MVSLRTLKRKIKSIRSTQQITRAMKMVAAARLTRAQNRILSARPFANKMESLLNELAYLMNKKEGQKILFHPFLARKKSPRVDVVLVTADRGLCGAFNANLIRRTVQFLREHPQDQVHLWLVGKKAQTFFRRYKARVENEYVGFFQRLTFQQAEIIGRDLIDAFTKTDSREVLFIYNAFKSRLSQELTEKTLLPIHEVPEQAPRVDYIYEPTREEILEGLFPRYIKAQIFRILLESQAAELAARMNAMENATNNASDLIQSLTLTMNKLRQATITKELTEIVSGAEALQTA